MKKYNFLIILALALFCQTCADLDELTPINEIPSDIAINNVASATAALNGIYDELQDPTLVFDGWLALPQYFSDECNATGTFPTRLEYGNLNVFPANTTAAAVFSDLYDAINVANNVIEKVPLAEDESFSPELRNDYVGQAKLIRAHCYLHLVTLWGEVPLMLTPTAEIGEVLFVNRASVAEIYASIIDDLTEAERSLLAETGPSVASKQAARAFLARVALYQGRWNDALSFAEAALGGSGFDLTTVPFLQDQIYILAFNSADGNDLNFFYAPADTSGRYSIGPSQSIIDAFETGDTRLPLSINLTTFAQPFGVKYPSFEAGSSGTATDPIYFIRHSEMVLIAAEAAAENGDFDTASDYFNQVRTRAGLAPITLTAGNYVDAILKERFTEFAFEGPFRLIDLRRRGKAQEVLGPIGYDACDNVWPIPQRDVDRNPNLNQNDCCNC